MQTLVFLFQGFLATLVGYLLLLTAAAWRAPKNTPARSEGPQHRFLILVPAHNEERLLPGLLANLHQLDYPRSLYAVHVIADNCTDKTAEIARQGGAMAHERTNPDLRGKGYALQWLLHRLQQANEPHDAVVILDADSIVSPNFLRVMDARLARGERVIQSYYAVRNQAESWSAGLRYAALAVLHYLRPSGRMVLGGSAGLKGNGMVFAADVLKQHHWSASVTEDIEFHMALVLADERVMFAPDATVWAEMPTTLAGSQSQNTRWEQGRLQMARKYIPALWQRAWEKGRMGEYGRSFLLLDAILEHLIPPFSILIGLSGLSFLAGILLPGSIKFKQINRFMGVFTILGQLIYLLAGLKLVNAPRSIYRSLLYVPLFILWKIGLYLRVWTAPQSQEWVRTRRNVE